MSPNTDLPIISVDALQELLVADDLVIVDCRFNLMDPSAGRAEWQQSRIPGAIYADLDKDLAAAVSPDTGRHPLPDERSLCALLGHWGITPQTRVVVYDAAGGAIAARLWWLLRWLGHERVAVLDGGWQAWTKAEAVAMGAPKAIAGVGPYAGVAGSMPSLDVAAIESMDFSCQVLLDARDAARFAGEVEPIDPVKGHVPGARNLPFSQLLDASGRFLSRPELQQVFADVGCEAGASVTCMCGSGVTACHLILGAELAGLGIPSLYVGSWSEWIRDPEHPICPVNP